MPVRKEQVSIKNRKRKTERNYEVRFEGRFCEGLHPYFRCACARGQEAEEFCILYEEGLERDSLAGRLVRRPRCRMEREV